MMIQPVNCSSFYVNRDCRWRLTFLFGVVLAGSAVLGAEPPSLTSNLEIAKRQIMVFDPLLVRVTVTNGGREPVALSPAIDSEAIENVHYELVGPDDKPCKVNLKRGLDQGNRAFGRAPVAIPYELEAGSTMAFYSIIFRDPPFFTFEAPGSYTLSATIWWGKNQTVKAGPVNIEVLPAGENHRRGVHLRREALDYLYSSINGDVSLYNRRILSPRWTGEYMFGARDQLSPSEASESLLWGAPLFDLAQAKTQEARLTALENIRKKQLECEPFVQDFMGIAVAYILQDQEEFELSREFLTHLYFPQGSPQLSMRTKNEVAAARRLKEGQQGVPKK